MKSVDVSLYLVTNSDGCDEKRFLSILEAALQNGVTLVQLREKEKTSEEYYTLAVAVKKITDYYGVPLILDDRADIALAADAAGVHVGQQDLPAAKVRQLLGPNRILGVSAKTVEQAIAAESQGADYLGTGAMFPTTTKVITQPTSYDTLKAICKAVTIPVVAIGGINESNILQMSGSSVHGVAVVSAIMRSSEPGTAAKRLRELSDTFRVR